MTPKMTLIIENLIKLTAYSHKINNAITLCHNIILTIVMFLNELLRQHNQKFNPAIACSLLHKYFFMQTWKPYALIYPTNALTSLHNLRLPTYLTVCQRNINCKSGCILSNVCIQSYIFTVSLDSWAIVLQVNGEA